MKIEALMSKAEKVAPFLFSTQRGAIKFKSINQCTLQFLEQSKDFGWLKLLLSPAGGASSIHTCRRRGRQRRQ